MKLCVISAIVLISCVPDFESKLTSFDDQILCKPEPFEWNFSALIDNNQQTKIDLNHANQIDTNENKKEKSKVAKADKKKDATYSLSMDWGDDKDEKVEELYKCYHKSNLESVPYLLEDLERSAKQPRKDKSIFFLITTCFANNLLLLGKRQACAVESAAMHNPNRDVFLLFASPVAIDEDQYRSDDLETVSNFVKILNSYKNVYLRNINMETFAKNSPLDLDHREKIYSSKHPAVHMADFLRMQVLYKYGGMYIDTDFIIFKNFDPLVKTFITREHTYEFLNNGVIAFSHDSAGHELLHYIMEESNKKYNGSTWASIGPDLFTPLIKNLCNITGAIGVRDDIKCKHIRIYPANVFHEYTWFELEKVFNATHAEPELLKRVETSYGSHLFSSESRRFKLTTSDKSVINKLASDNCPKIYISSNLFNYHV